MCVCMCEREKETEGLDEEIGRQNNAGFKINAARRPGQGHITPDLMLIENSADIRPGIFSSSFATEAHFELKKA